jgi:hypothetical protein
MRLRVRNETRLTVFELVSSIHNDPAPAPSPHEPKPIWVFERTLFVFGSIRRRYGAPYSLTHTDPPAPAAAQGATPGDTLIFATTVGPAPALAATAVAAAASRMKVRTRIGRRYSGSGQYAPEPD